MTFALSRSRFAARLVRNLLVAAAVTAIFALKAGEARADAAPSVRIAGSTG